MRCTMARTHREREREFGRGEKSGVERTLLEYYYSNYVFMASLSDLYETFIVRYLPIPPTFIHTFFSLALCWCAASDICTYRWNVHREIGFWCANAIKMEANQSNKKEKKLRLLYRHDLLFLGLNPHLYRIVLTFARLLCVVDVFPSFSVSLSLFRLSGTFRIMAVFFSHYCHGYTLPRLAVPYQVVWYRGEILTHYRFDSLALWISLLLLFPSALKTLEIVISS